MAADSRRSRDGRFLETLGIYNPQATPKTFTYDVDRMSYWIKQGAEVSETIANLLKQDRFQEKLEGISKGLTIETMALERKPERKRKPKVRKVKAE